MLADEAKVTISGKILVFRGYIYEILLSILYSRTFTRNVLSPLNPECIKTFVNNES